MNPDYVKDPETMDTMPTLHAVIDDMGVCLTGIRQGPVPTISVNAGAHIVVEVDPSDVSAPVAINVSNLDEADVDLRDLLGSPTVNQLRDAVDAGAETTDLAFRVTEGWTGLASLAAELWNERWNVFALDPSLMAVDRIIAAGAAQSFGRKIIQDSLPRAIPALEELTAQKNRGQLSTETVNALDAALVASGHVPKALDVSGMSTDEEIESDRLVSLAEARLPGSDEEASEAGLAGIDSTTGEILFLRESADWRLTGLGMASTGENAVVAEYIEGRRDLVKIFVPAQERIPERGRSDEPFYQGIITDPLNGEVIAHAHMALNEAGDQFEGTAPLARPLQLDDILDIRHPLVGEPVQRDIKIRRIDRIRRTAARAYAFERLVSAAASSSLVGRDVARAWTYVGKEVEYVQRDFPALDKPLRGWLPVADAYRHRALKASTRSSDRYAAEDIEDHYGSTGLPDLELKTSAAPTLAERQLVGTLTLTTGPTS